MATETNIETEEIIAYAIECAAEHVDLTWHAADAYIAQGFERYTMREHYATAEMSFGLEASFLAKFPSSEMAFFSRMYVMSVRAVAKGVHLKVWKPA